MFERTYYQIVVDGIQIHIQENTAYADKQENTAYSDYQELKHTMTYRTIDQYTTA